MDKRWEDIVRDVEEQVKKAVEYVDKQVVPAARKESGIALKNLAAELDRLADKLHKD
jgi:hypothetical protein